MLFLKLIFRDEIHLYAKFLFYIFSHCLKVLLFQILIRGIHLWFKKDALQGLKNGCILLEKVLLKLNFQNKSRLYGNCLFYVLNIYCKRRRDIHLRNLT